jgi:hypothetical protein
MAIPVAVYHPRNPEDSVIWKIFNEHFESFEENYDTKFEKKYGYYRPVIGEVVRNYLACGDLKEGFARIKCPTCQHELFLAFSCKSRYLCPSCQQKRVILFGEHLENNVLFPVPHRQFVFSIPIMLRIYFKYDRSLLSKLCHCAYNSLLLFFRKHIGLKKGVPGAALMIHTFGNYPDAFHPHIHLIATDGLFRDNGTFYVMRNIDIKPLEEIFKANIFKMLKKEEKVDDDLIRKISGWKHSGFSVHNGVRIEKDNKKGREALAQYIARNAFCQERVTCLDSDKIIYRSKLQKEKDKGKTNFRIYDAEEFIAALTQHIPAKRFQTTRYYGHYSNKARGLRAKEIDDGQRLNEISESNPIILDVSEYKPKRIPSSKWRDCIKKIYEADPLECPRCKSEMKIIGFIDEFLIVKKILDHLGLLKDKQSRAPPDKIEIMTYEPFDDGWYQPHNILETTDF